MQKDFHYFATICAAHLAGFDPEESIAIGYASQFTDCCTKMLLKMADAPLSAATTQSQSELADSRIDLVALQDITRIWASFHFLPRDLTADIGKKSKLYKNKYHLICGPNGPLAVDTVNLVKGKTPEAFGMAMHVIADTWAHTYFAGTPSLVINDTTSWFYEILTEEEAARLEEEKKAMQSAKDEEADRKIETILNAHMSAKVAANAAQAARATEELNIERERIRSEEEIIRFADGQVGRKVKFNHNPMSPDDLVTGYYTNAAKRSRENSIMNLGHGRAGHLPDYSFIKYKYLPAWGNYESITKDNPHDYYNAFCQMIRAMRFLRGDIGEFRADEYDYEIALPVKDEIDTILRRRQVDASKDWKALAEKMMGCPVPDFEIRTYLDEYMEADKNDRDDTPFGRFIIAALAQKSMVTGKIYNSGNLLAGYSVDFSTKGFRGIKDFTKLVIGMENRK